MPSFPRPGGGGGGHKDVALYADRLQLAHSPHVTAAWPADHPFPKDQS